MIPVWKKWIFTVTQPVNNHTYHIKHWYNQKRKSYHNYYCPVKWGDSRNYDISLNSSKLGVERSADFLEEYIKERSK